MLCRSCKKNVDSGMRHAITANSCPFCGNQIFTSREQGLRNSISKVLIKNGLTNDDLIGRIVDDVLALTQPSSPVTLVEGAPAAPAMAAPSPVVVDDDGLTEQERNAPARVLTPAPRPTAQVAVAGVDPIAAAMRAFEEDNSDPFKRVDDQPAGVPEDSPDDAAGIFFMERDGGEAIAQKRKLAQQARAAGLTGGGAKRTNPAFSRS